MANVEIPCPLLGHFHAKAKGFERSCLDRLPFHGKKREFERPCLHHYRDQLLVRQDFGIGDRQHRATSEDKD